MMEYYPVRNTFKDSMGQTGFCELQKQGTGVIMGVSPKSKTPKECMPLPRGFVATSKTHQGRADTASNKVAPSQPMKTKCQGIP